MNREKARHAILFFPSFLFFFFSPSFAASLQEISELLLFPTHATIRLSILPFNEIGKERRIYRMERQSPQKGISQWKYRILDFYAVICSSLSLSLSLSLSRFFWFNCLFRWEIEICFNDCLSILSFNETQGKMKEKFCEMTKPRANSSESIVSS